MDLWLQGSDSIFQVFGVNLSFNNHDDNNNYNNNIIYSIRTQSTTELPHIIHHVHVTYIVHAAWTHHIIPFPS